MNTEVSIARINQLGQTIQSAAAEIDQIFRVLAVQADHQLLKAATSLVDAHRQSRDPSFDSTVRAAQSDLMQAAVAAGSIQEIRERANELSQRANWWSNSFHDVSQFASDIRRVVNRSPRQES